MVDIQITGINEFKKKLSPEVFDKSILSSMTIIGANLKKWIVDNRLHGPRPNILGVKTGRLQGSITATKPIKDNNGYSMRIGTNVEYGRIHELGGVIRQKPRIQTVAFNKIGRFTKFKTTSKSKLKKISHSMTFNTGERVIVIRPRPFIMPAFSDTSNIAMIQKTFTEEFEKEIKP